MKKSIIALSVLSAVNFSANVSAEENAIWVGAFGEYYYADANKFALTPQDRIDWGYGIEAGKRFNPSWAGRIEVAKIDLETWSNNKDLNGVRFGVDAMYYPTERQTYLFGGVKRELLDTGYTLLNVGVGRHWDLSDSWKFITEVAAYHDFRNSYNDFSLKLGVAYHFGGAGYSNSSAKDADFDNVRDSIDQCPNTPSGVKVDSYGCSLDTDNDGIVNSIDKCPSTVSGYKVDSVGCALDDDNDGVVNSLDMCTNTSKSVKVDKRGCAVVLDDDKDGIINKLDKCPNSAANDRVDRNGCALFAKSTDALNLLVNFGNNSSVVSNPSSSEFVRFAEFMKKYPDVDATISGHSSTVGKESYNLWLSQQRANSVKALFVNKYGIAASRIKAIGFGETKLLDTSNTAAAHKANRRIEINVETTVETKLSK